MMGYQLSCFVHQADQDAIEKRLSAFASQGIILEIFILTKKTKKDELQFYVKRKERWERQIQGLDIVSRNDCVVWVDC